MIPVPGGVRVWLATGVTDMRRGMNTLALQVQEDLGRDPHAGDLYVFRGRKGDLVKILWHDGVGISLYAKRLERGRFQWPATSGGAVSIGAAQLGYLLEGIDWRNPVPRLLTELRIAHGEGTIPRFYADLARLDLLVLDDWGLAPLDAARRRDILEILDDRYGRRSIVLTSQMPVAEWHRQLDDPTLADAILDRLVHAAYRIELTGPSLRAEHAKRTPGP